MKTNSKNDLIANLIIIVFCLTLFLASLLGNSIFHWLTSGVATVTVIRCEREHDKYMVTAEDEVFSNVDKWCWLKFNSSDVQRVLRVGGTYEVKVSGIRWPFFSWYRNIISVNRTVRDPAGVEAINGQAEAN